MRTPVLIISTLSALGISIAYDQINQATGISLPVLLWAAVVTLLFGLCVGLTKKNDDLKETEES